MNLIPSFSAWPFAVAGLLAATGPILIHLLTRRRQRRVEWAAMDLLMQAARESRRRVQLRDWLLLLLRCLAVLLFGIALAQPFLVEPGSAGRRDQAIELIVLVDNSMSMSYETGAGTRLDLAKRVARERLQEMPPGSRYRVVPLCGSTEPRFESTSPIKADALQSLDSISTVDRTLTPDLLLDAAAIACRDSTPLPRRIVAISDLQALSFENASTRPVSDDLPAIQLIDVASAKWENSWIADVDLEDGVGDVGTASTITVRIGSYAAAERDVQIRLTVDGNVVGSRVVSLSPGPQERVVAFRHRFEEHGLEMGQIRWASVVVSIGADGLPTDNVRYLQVPVANGLPVVFLDQYGGLEDRSRYLLGETLPIRRLLSPQGAKPSSVRLRHLRVEELTAETLADVRLVVIAGVADPSPAAPHLRRFVEEGGRLMIAAGGAFDPQLWSRFAVEDSAVGILPARLEPELMGFPAEAVNTTNAPFSIDFDSLKQNPFFRFAGSTETELSELYGEPLFFQAVRPILDTDGPGLSDDTPDGQIRVLAQFTDSQSTPFLVEREIGRGRVIFITTGLLSQWNTLAKTNAVLLYDRIVRRLLSESFAPRNFFTAEQLFLPLPRANRQTLARLIRPGRGGVAEAVEVGLIGEEQIGLVVERVSERGAYRVELSERDLQSGAVPQIEFSVNGSERESDLTPITDEIRDTLGSGQQFRIADDADSTLLSSHLAATLWWWITAIVLGLLVTEMLAGAEPRA